MATSLSIAIGHHLQKCYLADFLLISFYNSLFHRLYLYSDHRSLQSLAPISMLSPVYNSPLTLLLLMPKFRIHHLSPEDVPLHPSSCTKGPGFRPHTCRCGESGTTYELLWSFAEWASVYICDPTTYQIFLHTVIAVGYPLLEQNLILPSILWEVLCAGIPAPQQHQFMYYAERNNALLDLNAPGNIRTLEVIGYMIFAQREGNDDDTAQYMRDSGVHTFEHLFNMNLCYLPIDPNQPPFPKNYKKHPKKPKRPRNKNKSRVLSLPFPHTNNCALASFGPIPPSSSNQENLASPNFRSSSPHPSSPHVDSDDAEIVCLSSNLEYPPYDNSNTFESILAKTVADARVASADNVAESSLPQVPEDFGSNISGCARLLNVNDLRLLSFPTPSSSSKSKPRSLPGW